MATFDEQGNAIGADANPLPGRHILEKRDDGSAVLVVGLNPGDSANSLAAFYTIGGSEYGPAIANYNGWDWAPDSYAASHGARLAVIPAEWLKPSYTAKYGLFQGVAQPVEDAVKKTTDFISDAADRVTSAAQQAYGIGTNAAKWLILGLVAFAVIEVFSKVPTPRDSGRIAKRYRKRAARAVYNRIAGK